MKLPVIPDREKNIQQRPAAGPVIDSRIFDCIMSAHILFHKRVFCSLQATGLTAGQPKLLEFLADNGPVMQKDLARACGIEPSTIARLLPRMETSGLIFRRSMQGDRRAVIVSLTKQGQSRADLVKQVFLQCEAKAFTGLPPEKQEHLLAVFQKIEQNLQVQLNPQTGGGSQAAKDSALEKRIKREPSLHYYLMACQGLLQKQLFFRLSDTGLTPGQPKILEFLNHGEGCQQKEIAAACKIEPATVTSLLLKMETSGLIQRTMEHGNRRSLHVYLTERGRTMMQRTLAEMEETVRQAFWEIAQEQEGFRKDLEAVCRNLEETEKPGHILKSR